MTWRTSASRRSPRAWESPPPRRRRRTACVRGGSRAATGRLTAATSRARGIPKATAHPASLRTQVLRHGQKPKGAFAARVADIAAGTMKEVKIGEQTVLLSHVSARAMGSLPPTRRDDATLPHPRPADCGRQDLGDGFQVHVRARSGEAPRFPSVVAVRPGVCPPGPRSPDPPETTGTTAPASSRVCSRVTASCARGTRRALTRARATSRTGACPRDYSLLRYAGAHH